MSEEDQYPTVLDVVLGRAAGPVPSPMSLGTAILDLLTRVSSRKPVLLVIDDGQWFDTPSSEVCGFIGRRLASSTVKMVVEPPRFEWRLDSDRRGEGDVTGEVRTHCGAGPRKRMRVAPRHVGDVGLTDDGAEVLAPALPAS